MRNFAKFVLSFIFIASFAMAAFPYNVLKIFTQADRDAALAKVAEFSSNETWKENQRSYINLGTVVSEVESKTLSYAEFETRAAKVNANAYAIDAFAFFFHQYDPVFLADYLADTDYDDPATCVRKFYIIPSGKAAQKIDKDIFLPVVEKTLKQDDAADMLRKHGNFGIGVCRNYISRMNQLPREDALIKLKEMKRVIYKNITAGEDWKNLMVDLELAIQGLN